ncbi:MAG: Gmad2 immunoglobulin-like domain-containing protein [Chloroflexota bacterium]
MVSHRSLIWTLIASLILTSCRTFASPAPTPDSASEPTSLPVTVTPAPDYVTRLRNAEYQLGLSDGLRVVQLSDGVFSQGEAGGVDFTSVTMTDFIARGDLNGDGVDEYAAMVAENYGGTGTFVFLAVFIEAGEKFKFQTSVLVDDRPLVNELSISGGEIFLDATIHAANDPMCCPTLRTERHYRLTHNYLRMSDYVTFTPDGRPRTITIDFPANRAEVFRSIPLKGSVAIAPFENNLVYRIYDLGGVELAIGSITVTAADPGAPGTFDQTISLGNILSGAVIRLEVQDVNAEDGSLFAMDSVELVVK